MSILPPDPDSNKGAPCDEPGARIGLPPNITEIRCELARGHATRHAGRAGHWVEMWGSSDLPEPWPRTI